MKKRIRHAEPTLDKAKIWAGTEMTRLRNEGTAALSLSEDQRHDAVKALRMAPAGSTLEAILREYVTAKDELDGTALANAVAFWKSHHKPAGGVKTVTELMATYLQVKTEKGKRPRYIRDIRLKIGTFAKTFGDRHVHTITTQEIDDWIKDQGYQGITQTNYLTYLTGFFNFARRMKLIESNPADSEAIERPDLDEKTTEVFSVANAAGIMAAAVAQAPAIVPIASAMRNTRHR